MIGQEKELNGLSGVHGEPFPRTSYGLTRFVILRFLGFVYFIGFLVLANQIVPLIGHHGLLPADRYLDLVKARHGTFSSFFLLPGIFWFGVSDFMLELMAWVGVVLLFTVCLGYANPATAGLVEFRSEFRVNRAVLVCQNRESVLIRVDCG